MAAIENGSDEAHILFYVYHASIFLVRCSIGPSDTTFKALFDSVLILPTQNSDLFLDYSCAYRGLIFFKKSIANVCGIEFLKTQVKDEWMPAFWTDKAINIGWRLQRCSIAPPDYFTSSQDPFVIQHSVTALAHKLWYSKYQKQLEVPRQSFIRCPKHVSLKKFFGLDKEDTQEKEIQTCILKRKRVTHKPYHVKEKAMQNVIKKEITDYIINTMGTKPEDVRDILRDMALDAEMRHVISQPLAEETVVEDGALQGVAVPVEMSREERLLESALKTEDVLWAMDGVKSHYNTYTALQKQKIILLYETVLNHLQGAECTTLEIDDSDTLAAVLVVDLLHNKKHGYTVLLQWVDSSVRVMKARGPKPKQPAV